MKFRAVYRGLGVTYQSVHGIISNKNAGSVVSDVLLEIVVVCLWRVEVMVLMVPIANMQYLPIQ